MQREPGQCPPATSGDIWQCPETFLVVTTAGQREYSWLLGEKAGRLLNIPQGTGQPPTAKNDPAQGVNGAQVEKP